jgi:3-oxoadipate enol-lactonase
VEFARINGVTICYSVRKVRGKTGKPWLVFINSLGSDHRGWEAVLAGLGSGWNTLTYDKRGHGLSDVGRTPYEMGDHVADLDGLMTHVGIEKAALCGLSVGGMIAQGFAAKHPQRVAGLLLCNTGHRIGDVGSWNSRIDAVNSRGIAGVSDLIMQRWFTEAFRSGNPAVAGWRNMLERTSVDGYVGTVAALRDTDYTELAKGLKVPTLVVVSSEDLSTPPALGGELAGLIPGARLETIAGVAHRPDLEKPKALSALISKFLEEIGHV